MDILNLVRIFVRRWYVALPLLLLTVGVAAYVQTTVPAAYEATGSVLLERPEYDPSRLPISLLELEQITGTIEDDVAPESDADELIVRPRDTTSVEVVSIAETAGDAQARVSTVLAELREEIEAVQEAAEISEENRVLLPVEDGLPDPEELADGRYQVTVTAAVDDPAARVENPYDAGGTTAELLQVAVLSDAGHVTLEEQTGPDVEVEVETSTQDGAIISITTTGPDPNDVIEAFDPVRDALASELEARQERAEVPSSRHIQLEELARPAEVTDVSPPLDRAVAAILGVGGLLALAGAVIAESIVTRRRAALPEPGPSAAQETWWPLPDGTAEDAPSNGAARATDSAPPAAQERG